MRKIAISQLFYYFCNKITELNTTELTDIIVSAILDKKGSDVCIINLEEIPTAPASSFVICQGKTPTQTSAIADNVIDCVREKAGRKPDSTHGIRNGQWIIIDYGETMVHIFTPDFREFYNLEDLWADGNIVRIEDE